MRQTTIKCFAIFLLLAFMPLGNGLAQTETTALPEGFVYLADIAPEILQEVRYHGSNNFTGAPVAGYLEPVIILTHDAALALKNAGEACQNMGYALKVFDAYRPQSAVNYFINWAKQPETNISKSAFYPNINKTQLFKLGYLATKSGHSRGSTVDLTLVDLVTGQELDMGTPFDFLDPRSHFTAQSLTNEQIFNRALLRTIMINNGFKPYDKEWWHFTLQNEPYPKTYFDFAVK